MIKRIISRLGYTAVSNNNPLAGISRSRAERFPKWLEEAEAAGEDVNDFINKNVGNPGELLRKVFVPYLDQSAKIVLELGPGTGRFAREIISHIKDREGWKIHLVDHSQWIVTFLSHYFKEYENIDSILNDGISLKGIESDSVDIVFSNGVFIALHFPRFNSYGMESYRVLKKGGYFIFNYIDLEFEEGWNHLRTHSENPNFSFSYFTGAVVEKLFREIGFDMIEKMPIGNSVYVVFRKT